MAGGKKEGTKGGEERRGKEFQQKYRLAVGVRRNKNLLTFPLYRFQEQQTASLL